MSVEGRNMMHLALTVMLLLVGGLNRMTSGCMKGD